MDEPKFAETGRRLGYEFRDTALLAQAFTHASTTDSRELSNERLEFLGDAVLGVIACERLYRLEPELLEGEMTKVKSVVVSRRTCAEIANEMGLCDGLRLGKGMRGGGGLPQSLAAATLEAVIGAIYLDGGLEAAEAFIAPRLEPRIKRALRGGHQQNFKSVLQHVGQERFGESPVYLLLDEQGPDHAKCFEICVELGGKRFPSCWGQSKKDAEQQAALHALGDMGCVERDGDGHVRVVALDGDNREDKDLQQDGSVG